MVGGGTECGESAEELADKARRSLDIFSVKKVARLSVGGQFVIFGLLILDTSIHFIHHN